MFVSADDDDVDGRLTLQLGIRVSSSSSCVSPSPTATIIPSSSSSSSSEVSSTSSSSLFAPTTTTHDDNPPVVGWPPVRRTHSIPNRAKLQSISSSKTTAASFDDKNGVSNYVKVNMDGYLIGRKINLASFNSYQTLAQKLEDMFFNFQPSFLNMGSDGEKSITTDTRQTASKLLMGSSEFVLTFEDKEGDWMLVGDVPWRMFCNSVKRLRIMRTSAAKASMPVII